ncbi:hypothetical protein KCTC52924_03451 [Arenibacter antarcticus]
MDSFRFIPFLFLFFYLAIIFGILYVIYKWVSRFIALKQEHNDLLREIINRMDNK